MEAPTISQLRSRPPTVSLLTAAAAIGIGRTKAYELAKRDEFPVAVTRVSVIYRVRVTDLLRETPTAGTAPGVFVHQAEETRMPAASLCAIAPAVQPDRPRPGPLTPPRPAEGRGLSAPAEAAP